MAAVHPMEVVRNYLGPQYEAILHWAVGPDWMQHSFHEWPAMIEHRTGLKVAEDMETTFDMLRHQWEAARPTPTTAPTTAWPGSPAEMGPPMDMRATSIPGPRGIPPRPTPLRVASPPPLGAGAHVERASSGGSLDLLFDQFVDVIVERLLARVDARMTERLGGGRGL